MEKVKIYYVTKDRKIKEIYISCLGDCSYRDVCCEDFMILSLKGNGYEMMEVNGTKLFRVKPSLLRGEENLIKYGKTIYKDEEVTCPVVNLCVFRPLGPRKESSSSLIKIPEGCTLYEREFEIIRME